MPLNHMTRPIVEVSDANSSARGTFFALGLVGLLVLALKGAMSWDSSKSR
jgi:hypothetical protein